MNAFDPALQEVQALADLDDCDRGEPVQDTIEWANARLLAYMVELWMSPLAFLGFAG